MITDGLRHWKRASLHKVEAHQMRSAPPGPQVLALAVGRCLHNFAAGAEAGCDWMRMEKRHGLKQQ